MKYVLAFLSTSLFISILLNFNHYENIQRLQENVEISNKIIGFLSEIQTTAQNDNAKQE